MRTRILPITSCLFALTVSCKRAADVADEVPAAEKEKAHRAQQAEVPAATLGFVADRAFPGAAAPLPAEDPGADAYAARTENRMLAVATNPLSTFAADVDTASYANVRRFLQHGALPPSGAVRVEELINYFRYDTPRPGAGQALGIASEIGACLWNPAHRVVRITVATDPIDGAKLPPRNLVFLLDVSGSMSSADKLPLVLRAMELLVDTLRPQDHVAVVVYAGASGLVLPPIAGDQKEHIRAALAELQAGGSTNGGAGIRLAYDVAAQHFEQEGINRVVLCTDGDFNVGTTSQDELVQLIEARRRTGVFLTVLGVGRGNLKDSTMELLADRGNGNYAYLDDLAEARKVLVAEGGATLVTVAKDVKLQVEWNPLRVASWRLVGYENRVLADRDFDDDRKDGGELGAGHVVTALYEIEPRSQAGATRALRYSESVPAAAAHGDEWFTLRVRAKAPDGERSDEIVHAGRGDGGDAVHSDDFRFASAVAMFGMLLSGSEHCGRADFDLVARLAEESLGEDPGGLRRAFLALAHRAQELQAGARAVAGK